MLTGEWFFKSLKGGDGQIRVVTWQVKWKDEAAFPGQEMLSGGETVIEPLAESTATQAKLRDAVIKSLGPQYQLLQNHMTAQLAHQFQVAQFSQLNSQLAVPTDLAAYAADARWEKEAAGITFNGMPVMTDDRSKMMIMGARVKATDDPDFTTQWKTESGFVTLNAGALIAVSDAVLQHVDHCFGLEAQAVAGIADGSITTTAQINAIFA